MQVQGCGQCHVTPKHRGQDPGQTPGSQSQAHSTPSTMSSDPRGGPVCQRGDDQPARVSQVLITVLELCVGLADHTVVEILMRQDRMR